MKSLLNGEAQLWAFSALKGKLLWSEYSDPAKIWNHPRTYDCPITCKFDEDPIKIEGTIDQTRSNMGVFFTQGQETLKVIVSGQNSNTSNILWLSWFPARLMKIWSKVK